MVIRSFAVRSIMLSASAILLAQMPDARAQSASEGRVFRAGAAVTDITPSLDQPIVGRGGNRPKAIHIHDPMSARALVLDDGANKLVIVTIDNLGAPQIVFDAAKRMILDGTGIPADKILMSSTHTHSGTNLRGPGTDVGRLDQQLDPYQTFVARRIADGVRIAINNLAPARVGWGAGTVRKHVHNRRWFMKPGTPLLDPFGGEDKVKMNPSHGSPDLVRPAGPTDPQVSFLAVQSKEGQPIALLANYSLHYVGGTPAGHVSADYFAVFADRVQQLLGADRQSVPFVGIMTNGTSGDVTSTDRGTRLTKAAPYAKMREVAGDLANEVLKVYKQTTFHDWVPLQSAQAELTLQTRRATPEMLANARALLAKPASETPGKARERDYAGRIIWLEKAPKELNVPLQVFRIGDLAISAIPFETFAETGLEIKAKSPFKSTFTIELANGSFGYLPTPEQHALGGYETWLGTSRAEEKASRKITDKILDMFKTLR